MLYTPRMEWKFIDNYKFFDITFDILKYFFCSIWFDELFADPTLQNNGDSKLIVHIWFRNDIHVCEHKHNEKLAEYINVVIILRQFILHANENEMLPCGDGEKDSLNLSKIHFYFYS